MTATPTKAKLSFPHLPNAINVEFNSTYVEQSYHNISFKIIQSKKEKREVINESILECY